MNRGIKDAYEQSTESLHSYSLSIHSYALPMHCLFTAYSLPIHYLHSQRDVVSDEVLLLRLRVVEERTRPAIYPLCLHRVFILYLFPFQGVHCLFIVYPSAALCILSFYPVFSVYPSPQPSPSHRLRVVREVHCRTLCIASSSMRRLFVVYSSSLFPVVFLVYVVFSPCMRLSFINVYPSSTVDQG
jgi:hypothetical protein